VLLKREGWNVGKKLVYRLYREEGLTLRYKPRRRRCAATNRRERCKPTAPNQVWSLDFVADQLTDGRRFRALTVVDVFTRESLAIELGQSLKGADVARILSRLGSQRGGPKMLFCDNGSEFTSQAMDLCVSGGCADRLLATGEADRQRVCRIFQRNLPGGVPGRALVRDADGSETDHRGMAAGIQ